MQVLGHMILQGGGMEPVISPQVFRGRALVTGLPQETRSCSLTQVVLCFTDMRATTQHG